VEWLWDGRLPFGKLVLVDGDPGLGKSAATLDIAARVSSGAGFPDSARCEPAGVILLSAEDGLADTIRPRLDAAGADVGRILSLATVEDEDGHPRLLSIPDDLEVIEKGIERVGAGLIVVDPLMAFLSGKADSNKDQDVRKALAPLADLADRSGVCVVVVRHLNKSPHSNPLYRGGGSIGIIGAARAGFVVAKNPQNEDQRILATTKNNLSASSASLAFTLEDADNGAVKIVWTGESELGAKDLLATSQDGEKAEALNEAVEFLQDILSEGPVSAEEVKREAEEAGISEATLRRAKKELDIHSQRNNDSGKSRGKEYGCGGCL